MSLRAHGSPSGALWSLWWFADFGINVVFGGWAHLLRELDEWYRGPVWLRSAARQTD